MFIARFIKFFIKLFLVLLVVAAIFIGYSVNGWLNHTHGSDKYDRSVINMVSLYAGAVDRPAGTYIKCPWAGCKKQFYKKTDDDNFCCEEHEKKYWEAVNAYEKMKSLEETDAVNFE
jgi:hypothetical protein